MRFVSDVLRAAAVHLIAGATARGLEKVAIDGVEKAKKVYDRYKHPEIEDAVEVKALDAMRDLKKKDI